MKYTLHLNPDVTTSVFNKSGIPCIGKFSCWKWPKNAKNIIKLSNCGPLIPFPAHSGSPFPATQSFPLVKVHSQPKCIPSAVQRPKRPKCILTGHRWHEKTPEFQRGSERNLRPRQKSCSNSKFGWSIWHHSGRVFFYSRAPQIIPKRCWINFQIPNVCRGPWTHCETQNKTAECRPASMFTPLISGSFTCRKRCLGCLMIQLTAE